MNTSNKITVTIRRAEKNDHPTIVDFQLRMALETEKLSLDPGTVSRGVMAVLNDNSKGQYFVADGNGKVVASLLITYEWSDWRNGTVWWIQSVYVIPDYRGKKIFKQMYLFLKKQVEEYANITGLRLYVDNRNRKAQEVYRALGMNGNHYATFEWMK
jgi:ribosomal protein S18 acetylase RimI-like enzyme